MWRKTCHCISKSDNKFLGRANRARCLNYYLFRPSLFRCNDTYLRVLRLNTPTQTCNWNSSRQKLEERFVDFLPGLWGPCLRWISADQLSLVGLENAKPGDGQHDQISLLGFMITQLTFIEPHTGCLVHQFKVTVRKINKEVDCDERIEWFKIQI